MISVAVSYTHLQVIGLSLVPSPPAIIIAFILKNTSFRLRNIVLKNESFYTMKNLPAGFYSPLSMCRIARRTISKAFTTLSTRIPVSYTHLSTLIFDEIDTGISGKAAKSVAQKLKSISKNHQVICVTHHAQIAAAADHNIYIRKSFDGISTHTTVETLDEEAKIREISRLLDGDAESEITAVHARELVAKFRTN